MSCEAIEAVLEQRPGAASEDPAVRSHLERCAACADHARLVALLDGTLAAEAPAPASPEVVARCRARAARALRAHAPPPARGLLRELAAALAVMALALPLTIAHAWLVAEGAGALLGGILPRLVLEGLGVVYFGSLALAVGTLYALLPLWVATVRRARMEAA